MAAITESEIRVPLGAIHLTGNLAFPKGARGLVIFSHGSGSSRFSPRNRHVAEVLNKAGMATLLIDLLTIQEDAVYENRFDIDLLTSRLIAVTEYMHKHSQANQLPVGYFGASTGAASAINAAERLNTLIAAIVSRGGRPDLADPDWPLVKAPTLLIVGSLDVPVIGMNREAYNHLRCEKRMVIVEGATHLFEEEGKLEEVAKLAANWFKKYLLKEEPATQKT